MSQADVIEHGPPPAGGGCGFGARAVVIDGRYGVRLMLKGFNLMDTPGGSVAFVEVGIPNAVQAVQALRQAISDARKLRLR